MVKPKQSSEPKRAADKSGPKRPLSSYMHFAKKQRPILKTDHPEASFKQLGSMLGEEWRKLTPAQKEPYEKMASEDKKRFEQEKSAEA